MRYPDLKVVVGFVLLAAAAGCQTAASVFLDIPPPEPEPEIERTVVAQTVDSAPVRESPEIELVDAKAAFELVLAKAGCWPRDRTTTRTVHEVTTKTGNWGRNAPLEPTDEWFLEGLTPIKAPADTDGDGLPDAWEKTHGIDFNDSTDAATTRHGAITTPACR